MREAAGHGPLGCAGRLNLTRSKATMADKTKDPVCGMQVDKEKAVAKSNYQGKEYCFCAEGCKRKFDTNPEAYVTTQEG